VAGHFVAEPNSSSFVLRPFTSCRR